MPLKIDRCRRTPRGKTLPDSTWTVGYIGRVRDMAAMESIVGAVKIAPRPLSALVSLRDGVEPQQTNVRRLMNEVENRQLRAEVIKAPLHKKSFPRLWPRWM